MSIKKVYSEHNELYRLDCCDWWAWSALSKKRGELAP